MLTCMKYSEIGGPVALGLARRDRLRPLSRFNKPEPLRRLESSRVGAGAIGGKTGHASL